MPECLVTCVPPLILPDMKLFVHSVQLKQISQLLPVQLHVRHPHCGFQTAIVLPFLPQQQEHILGHTVNKSPVFIWDIFWEGKEIHSEASA